MPKRATSSYLIPNLYDPDRYFTVDIGPGRITNPQGQKMVAISSYLLRGLYVGLKNECGPAWTVVLKRCGEIWGDHYTRRFLQEIEAFYQEGLSDMSMARFNALIAELFASHGWGRLEIDYSLIERGVIMVVMENPILGDVLRDAEEDHLDVLLAGIFRALFSAVSGQALQCYQTECISKGFSKSRFVIALAERMKDIPDMLEKKATHADVLDSVLKRAPHENN